MMRGRLGVEGHTFILILTGKNYPLNAKNIQYNPSQSLLNIYSFNTITINGINNILTIDSIDSINSPTGVI